MNKKGFTLVELLAVIVIIAVVSLIGTVSLVAVRKNMNKKMFETKLSEVTSAGAKWGEDNKSEVDSNGTLINIGYLIDSKYFKTDESVSISKVECEKYSGASFDGNKCNNVVTNNINGDVVNNLQLVVYSKNNRVYAVIANNDNNKALLEDRDVDYSAYSEYYDGNENGENPTYTNPKLFQKKNSIGNQVNGNAENHINQINTDELFNIDENTTIEDDFSPSIQNINKNVNLSNKIINNTSGNVIEVPIDPTIKDR